ncbi:response regulator transcription factor [Roseivivax sediminis]|uniref:DNA-binding response regulator, OmpR family, contains REC and winged-helix (WHTH) domain n=1 Tax=Roseivivax sediminis TaxID=936889 RepID=A0A1I1VRT4_9RHOB|nr:response regulator transcription factor [Roseivivax sediminis]SFD83733.1 DNA-binding response regulator, OmpR family, contains REC and winged-helix (wHTH) domain [Roseivivax sediminis]
MTTPSPSILLVDDDPEITSALSRGLALHGYAAVAEHRVAAALERIDAETFDAAIVDVMLGPESGLDLVRAMREGGFLRPVVVLSALSDVEDRAAGLEAGADDYIVKPFSFEELIARLKVQERRAATAHPAPATLDPATRRLSTAARAVTLTERECDLLRLLAENAGEVMSRGAIFDALWAAEGSSSENVVDVYVGYLRKKLSPDFGFEIKTLRNRGFTLSGTAPRIEAGHS